MCDHIRMALGSSNSRIVDLRVAVVDCIAAAIAEAIAEIANCKVSDIMARLKVGFQKETRITLVQIQLQFNVFPQAMIVEAQIFIREQALIFPILLNHIKALWPFATHSVRDVKTSIGVSCREIVSYEPGPGKTAYLGRRQIEHEQSSSVKERFDRIVVATERGQIVLVAKVTRVVLEVTVPHQVAGCVVIQSVVLAKDADCEDHDPGQQPNVTCRHGKQEEVEGNLEDTGF